LELTAELARAVVVHHRPPADLKRLAWTKPSRSRSGGASEPNFLPAAAVGPRRAAAGSKGLALPAESSSPKRSVKRRCTGPQTSKARPAADLPVRCSSAAF
jgi:hypothetical protein